MTATSMLLGRHCLVTVGATVGFKELTEQVLEPAFWDFLRSQGFATLHIQCGPDIPWASTRLSELQDELPSEFDVQVFDVKSNLMMEEMMLCKAIPGRRSEGLVISHADAWKLGVQLIVVPNTGLLDNHQEEMAQYLAKEGYATMAIASRQDLQDAIHKTGLLFEDNKTRWPRHSISPQHAPLRLWDVKPLEVENEENSQMSLG